MVPLVAASLIGAGGSLLSSGMSNMFSQNNAEVSYQRQKELMALQQKYAVENWNREANYNDPKQQMKRLKDAGLNPNLVYGNGAAGLEAPSTAAPTAPGAPMAQTVPFSNFAAEGAQVALAINQAKKADADTVGQTIENEFLSKTLQDRIEAVAVQNNWTKEQTAKVSQEISYIVGQQNALREQVENIKKEGQLTQKQIDWFERRMTAEINQMKATTRYQDALKDLTKTQKEQLEGLFDETKRLLTSQADMAARAVELCNKYGDAQAIVGMLSDIVDSATDLLSFWKPKLSRTIK